MPEIGRATADCELAGTLFSFSALAILLAATLALELAVVEGTRVTFAVRLSRLTSTRVST